MYKQFGFNESGSGILRVISAQSRAMISGIHRLRYLKFPRENYIKSFTFCNVPSTRVINQKLHSRDFQIFDYIFCVYVCVCV